MEKWYQLKKHGWTSFVGLFRMFCQSPGFALRLFARRLVYFLTRKFHWPLETPEGFRIDTPDTLISYWSMFVELELCDLTWIIPLREATRPLILDVGANAGVFSHFIHRINPGCEIIAFEPLPKMAERIEALKERTGVDVVCVRKAVSNTEGEAFLESPHGYDGISKLATARGSGDHLLRVQTVTLDSVLKGRKPTLIKIDVEGFECEVLQGARETLAQADFLIVEAQTKEHFERISELLGQSWKSTKLGSSDYLFHR